MVLKWVAGLTLKEYPAGNHAGQNDHNGDDEEKMDEAVHRRARHHAGQPQDEQHVRLRLLAARNEELVINIESTTATSVKGNMAFILSSVVGLLDSNT